VDPTNGTKIASRIVISSVEQHDTLLAHLSVWPFDRKPHMGTPDRIG